MCFKILAQIEMLYEQITVATKTAVINKKEKSVSALISKRNCDFTSSF